jgi:hypothetical protein
MNTWYFIKCWQDLIDNILRYIEGSNRFNFSLIHYFCTFFLDSLRVFRTTYFYPYSMEVYIFHENNMQWLSTLVFNPVHMIIHIGFHFCVQYIITFRKHLVSPSVFLLESVFLLFLVFCVVCVCVCVLYCFVCLRTVYCVHNVASVFGFFLFILVFSNVY